MAKTDSIREPAKSQNKARRAAAFLKYKKAKESQKRDFRLRRRREEDKNPQLRVARRARNVPITTERKRVWDDADIAEGDGLGLSVDLSEFKRRKVDDPLGLGKTIDRESDTRPGLTEEKLKKVDEESLKHNKDSDNDRALLFEEEATDADEDLDNAKSVTSAEENDQSDDEDEDDNDDHDADDLESLLNESDNSDEDHSDSGSTLKKASQKRDSTNRPSSPPASTTSTNISLIPDALAAKFPTLFAPPPALPKILITTAFNAPLHDAAKQLTDFFPNSMYVPRQRHRYKSHHFSLREISRFASNRNFTTLLVLNPVGHAISKVPGGLTAIHLPSGPTFHFSLTNWVSAARIPGHGRSTEHDPELILNGFRTPLGLLTAHFFRTLFPSTPEIGGRQVVTLHNQRDYIFVRRHRYQFREKRDTERSVTDPGTGKSVKGAEDVKAGLQELGPRFTLKLRRVDKGIQRASGQEWEWASSKEKTRAKFQL